MGTSTRQERRITFTGPERAELLPAERDSRPLGPKEVAGRTLTTLVSAGTELNGGYLGAHFPVTTGYAAVFEVEEVGAEVESHRPGDLVFCMGPHRSFQRVAEDQALQVPQGLHPDQAVFARLMGVTLSTLTTTSARPPERVLVTGLGLVGHLGARIFAACGYEVTGCDPAEPRRETARRLGLKDVREAVPVMDPEVKGQVSLVLECSSHEQAALDACRVVRKGGEVVLVGTPWRRRTDLTAHELLHLVFHNYVVLRSGWEWEVPLHPQEFRHNSLYGNLAAALKWLAEGRITVDGLATITRPEQAQETYQALLRAEGTALTAVFDWSAGD